MLDEEISSEDRENSRKGFPGFGVWLDWGDNDLSEGHFELHVRGV